MSVGMILRDSSGRVLDCNAQAAAILDVSREALISRAYGNPSWKAVREGGVPFPPGEEPAQVTLRTGEPCLDVVMGVSYERHSRHWVMTSTASVPLEGGDGVISAFFEITPRIRTRRILKLVAEGNRIVISSQNEAECLQQLCDTLVAVGGYKLAWIGAPSPEDHSLDVRFAAGATDYLLDDNRAWWQGREGSRRATAAHEELHIVNDLADHDWGDAQRARSLIFDLGSSILLPLDVNGKSAALIIYDDVTYGFDEVTVAGLQQ